MRSSRDHSPRRARVAILYHSAAGGTRVVAQLLGELLSPDHDARVTSIFDVEAAREAVSADLIVLCYPTYFLRPSPSTKEFIGRLARPEGPRRAYLVTTYELYPENSLRACALSLKAKGISVTGSAAIRAPGSDLTCVFPDWLCTWLYRFEGGFPKMLRSVAREIAELAQHGGRERIPRLKWYTPVAQPLQRAFLDGFFQWRDRIRVLSDRCTDCGACVSRCKRGAWERHAGIMRHHPERCELCTACIHHCAQNAIILSYARRDNKRLNARHYAGLKSRARAALFPSERARGST